MIMKTTRGPMQENMENESMSHTGDTGKRLDAKKILLLGLFIVLVSSLAANYFFQRRLSDLKQNPQKLNQEETAQLVERVGKIIILPEGEQPTVATVADLSRLKDQPFFAKAQVGFKVLLYTQSRKAILYDPVENKIVEVAPINIGDTGATQ
ncbi:MAG: hypothetical protein Q7S66_01040 [bacterium]|nr:hypothetical protein [bacterium]